VAAIKFDLKNILTHRLLPGGDAPGQRGLAKPFTAYFCRDDQSLWISDSEGNLISLSDLLAGEGAPRAFPAQGPAGRDGAPGIKGDRGPQGPAGRDGSNGRDSTTPGPQGRDGDRGPQGPAGRDGRDGKDGADSTVPGPIGAAGPQGPAGPKGDVLIPNDSELAAAVIQLRQQRARVQASLLQAILDADRLPPSTRMHVKLFLDTVRKDAGL
jgi:hypothetical protein